MKHTHVCLVSDQPMPNVTSCLQLQPDMVELLYTKDKIEHGLRLEELLKSRGIEVRGTEIDPYDMQNVMGVCTGLITNSDGNKISLNCTGGTKVSSLAAFQIFFSAQKEIYYVNTFENEIIRLAPDGMTFPITVSIPILEFLDVHGFRPESFTTDDNLILNRQQATEFLAELSIHKPKLIGSLNYSFKEDVNRLTYPFTLHLPATREFAGLASLLAKLGIAQQAQNGIIIPTIEIAQYLRGFWFEEYVYLAAKSVAGVEVKLNIIGRWETRRKEEPKNEFDVMIGSGNRLLYISCKTSNVDKGGAGREYLYELDSLGDHALGLFGKKILASARPITDNYIHARAASMGIEIIDGDKIREIPKRIEKWLNR